MIAGQKRPGLSALRRSRIELVSQASGALEEDLSSVPRPLGCEQEFVEFRGDVARLPAVRGNEAEIPVGDPVRFSISRKKSDLLSVRREARRRVDSGSLDQVPDRAGSEVDRANVRSIKILNPGGRLGGEGDPLPVGRPGKVDDGRRFPRQLADRARGRVHHEELQAGDILTEDDDVLGPERSLLLRGRLGAPGQEGDLAAVGGPDGIRGAALDRGGLAGLSPAQADEPDLARTVPVGEESDLLAVGRPSRRPVPAGTRREPPGRSSLRFDQPDAAADRVAGQVDLGKDIGHPVTGRRDPGFLDIADAEQGIQLGRSGGGKKRAGAEPETRRGGEDRKEPGPTSAAAQRRCFLNQASVFLSLSSWWFGIIVPWPSPG